MFKIVLNNKNFNIVLWKVSLFPKGSTMLNVRKEMKSSGDSEILHELVRDTERISSCFSEFHVVLQTI